MAPVRRTQPSATQVFRPVGLSHLIPTSCLADYCYCNTYRSTPDRRIPMHITIKDLKAYHKSIGLRIDMYHLDSGFWHSAHSDGHCDGVYPNQHYHCCCCRCCCRRRRLRCPLLDKACHISDRLVPSILV